MDADLQEKLRSMHDHMVREHRDLLRTRKKVYALDAIETALAGGTPKGVLPTDPASGITKLDTAVGLREIKIEN